MTESNSVVVEVGQRFPLTAKKIGINGEGIGYFQHKVTFVPGLLPDEVAVVEATQVTDRYIRGKIHQLRHRSAQRATDAPAIAGEVGGLELAHLKYPQQVFYKNDLIKQALERYKPRGYQHYEFLPAIGADNPWHYRNKAQFPIGKDADGKLISGLYQPNTQNLVDLPEMPTQSELTLSVVRRLLPILTELDMPVYDATANSGIIKAVAVRESKLHHQVQLTFITNSKKMPHKQALLVSIAEKIPEVTGIFQNLNQTKRGLFWGDETWQLAGENYLEEQVGKLRFLLSPRAFFQLDLAQTEKLYQVVADFLAPKPSDTLLDAYAGVGTIGLTLAGKVKSVTGIEEIPESVADAKQNAVHNRITNATYHLGKVETELPKLQADGQTFSAMIVDPPRVGLAPKLMDTILEARPKTLIYISCNESTLAQNLVKLTRSYRVEKIQMIDMFPQTARVEAVVKLVLSDK
ncbi:23S rRNA (uracil(1939)-C(5))-methyltransferase RlmD [Lapidilactobacillus mulanensis]|uniref:23S rRNA (Uracil(1939)-C(5))-methyltransferase RlmD n=1 Tax=Lapidilactobacillus mulanensis TaxID=2485999 RepID=A0ABW4DMV6_9LACO|nr:23S rRNA (uracil(1939)-C(5))-methyltransferase RlmD [Lapidilactobacillus mulanensis]